MSETSLAPAPRRLPAAVIAAVVVAAVALIMTLALSFAGLQPVRPAPGQLVYRLEGDGPVVSTETFRVEPGWEIRWEHEGTLDHIRWIESGGRSQSVVSLFNKPLRNFGSVNVHAGGEYHLDVKADGKWRVAVYQFAR